VLLRLPTLASAVSATQQRALLRSSRAYWEHRYASGSNSGDGSYGAAAERKAAFINSFVRTHGIATVVEFGCGDGNQLRLAEYPAYVGLDVSPTAVRICADEFRADESKSFFLYRHDAFFDRGRVFKAELGLSLDVIFHLLEDDVFERHLEHLFDSSEKWVLVHSTNAPIRDGAVHVRHRRFTDWVAVHRPEWRLVERASDRRGAPNDANARFFVFERAA
jgi:SAM-dependent methyltransferase